MRKLGSLYLLTAVISGYWEVYLMLRPLIGGPSSPWYEITLAASVVLLVAGIFTMLNPAKWPRVMGLAASLVLAAWWIPAATYTVHHYLSPKGPAVSPVELLWPLLPGFLIMVSVTLGIVTFGYRRASRNS